MTLRLAKWGFPWWRYVRNSAYYHYFRKAPSIKEVHQAFSHWDVPISSDATGGQLYENEELRSLWLIKRCLEEVSRQRILNLVQYLQELASTKEESAGWYFVLLWAVFLSLNFPSDHIVCFLSKFLTSALDVQFIPSLQPTVCS